MRFICMKCGQGGADREEAKPLCHSKTCKYETTMIHWSRELENIVIENQRVKDNFKYFKDRFSEITLGSLEVLLNDLKNFRL